MLRRKSICLHVPAYGHPFSFQFKKEFIQTHAHMTCAYTIICLQTKNIYITVLHTACLHICHTQDMSRDARTSPNNSKQLPSRVAKGSRLSGGNAPCGLSRHEFWSCGANISVFNMDPRAKTRTLDVFSRPSKGKKNMETNNFCFFFLLAVVVGFLEDE